MTSEIIASLISAIVDGLLVAVVNHMFTRKKTEAEVKKLEMEARKIEVETTKILTEFGKLSTTIKDGNYRIIYDGRQNADAGDFDSKAEKLPNSDDAAAQGLFSVKENALSIERQNTTGRFQIFLRKYYYDGKELDDCLPKNELLDGKRKLRVRFDAKVTKGSHTLLIVVKNPETQIWLAHKKLAIDFTDWKSIELIFRIPPNEPCFLRFDDQELTAISNLHLRNLTFAEYIN